MYLVKVAGGWTVTARRCDSGGLFMDQCPFVDIMILHDGRELILNPHKSNVNTFVYDYREID